MMTGIFYDPLNTRRKQLGEGFFESGTGDHFRLIESEDYDEQVWPRGEA